jgi:hypothetical protein
MDSSALGADCSALAQAHGAARLPVPTGTGGGSKGDSVDSSNQVQEWAPPGRRVSPPEGRTPVLNLPHHQPGRRQSPARRRAAAPNPGGPAGAGTRHGTASEKGVKDTPILPHGSPNANSFQ